MVNPFEKDTDINNSRYYSLKQACKSGILSTVQSILQSKSSTILDFDQPEPITPDHLQKCLFEAFTNSNFDVAHYLIHEVGAEIESSMIYHASTKSTSVEAFEFLVQEGWDVNAHVYESRTALSFALASLPLTQWLLEHGANPNLGPDHPFAKRAMVSNSGFVLNLAACVNPAIAVTIIDLLIKHGAKLENSLPLHLAAECSLYQSPHRPTTSDAISYPPVQAGLDPESTTTTPSSRISVLRHLLSLGYDPNASDMAKFGAYAHGPPLHWAVRWGRVENARFLLENGADPRGKDRHGRDALEAVKQELSISGHEMEKVIKEFM